MNILHIGYPKSASTSIQWNIFANCKSHVYISRENNGGQKSGEAVYDVVSNCILDGTPRDEAVSRIKGYTDGKKYIFSDERILLHFGKKKTSLVERVPSCREIFGNCKVLMVVRNPVAQIVSLYKHIMIQKYQVDGSLPTESIDSWIGDLSESRFWIGGDVTQGLFFGRIAALYAMNFGMSNVHVVFFEDFIRGGDAAYAELASDLGLNDFEAPKEYVRMNSTGEKLAFREISENPKSKYNAHISKSKISEILEISRGELDLLKMYVGKTPSAGWLENVS